MAGPTASVRFGVSPWSAGLPPASLFVVAVLLAASLAAQGNQRDAAMTGTTSGIPLEGLRLMEPGNAVQLLVASPQGSLVGLPYLLVADFSDGNGPPVLVLPGEPGVLGVSAACVPVVNSFGTGPSLLAGAAPSGLPAGGFPLAFLAPNLPPGTRLNFQAAVADATAPNGLAITTVRGGEYRLLPTLTPIFPPSPTTLGQFGYGLTVADLNGGGDELIVGERLGNAPGTNNAGRVSIYTGLVPSLLFSLYDPAPQAFSEFGCSIGTGDFNGDGFRDLVVGERLFDASAPLSDQGKVVLFYGPSFTTTHNILPPSPEFRGQFGHWTSCGDFDGDGFCDLAVSSIGATVSGVGTAGRVDIFFGPSLAPAFAFLDPAPVFGDRFGYRMEAADFNLDGFADLAVAATFRSLLPSGTDDSGALWVFSGPFLATTGYIPNPTPSQNGLLGADMAIADVDLDGFPDIVAGSELDNSGGLTDQGSVLVIRGPFFQTTTRIYSPAPLAGAGFGGGVAVGDFNKDDVPDLLVGEFLYTNPIFHAGRTTVLYGPDYLQSTIILEPVMGSDFQFGRRVRAADLEANGGSEIIVGAPFSSASGTSRGGAIYIVQ